jgi:hypothetical protein
MIMPKCKKKRKAQVPPKYTPDYLSQLAKDLIEWFGIPTNFFLKKFCWEKKIPSKHFFELSQKSEELKHALAMCKDAQETRLFEIGMMKNGAASMAIFALKNVAGWRDVTPEKPKEKDDAIVGEELVILPHNRIANIQANMPKYMVN